MTRRLCSPSFRRLLKKENYFLLSPLTPLKCFAGFLVLEAEGCLSPRSYLMGFELKCQTLKGVVLKLMKVKTENVSTVRTISLDVKDGDGFLVYWIYFS